MSITNINNTISRSDCLDQQTRLNPLGCILFCLTYAQRQFRFNAVTLMLLTLVSLMSLGCHSRRVLIFSTGTSIGIEATAEDGIQQHLLVGFKRFEGALVPTVNTTTSDNTVRTKAYSTFATLDFSTGLLKPTRIIQVFGTGVAANTLAGSPSGMSNMISEAKGLDAEYNVTTIPLQDRIVAWLGKENSPERQKLRTWMKEELNVTSSEVLWVFGSGTDENDLKAAIAAFNVP